MSSQITTRVGGNEYQTRIGRQVGHGPFFPETQEGDELVVFGTPARIHKDRTPKVTIMVNAHAADLTPREARALAFSLLFHAKQVDPRGEA